MSFVDFLLKYYVWILGVLVVLIITVIGFLADARSKKKKALKVENNAGNVENNMQEQGAVIPQPVQEQSIMQPEVNNLNSGINEMVSPVGDLNLNSNPIMNNSQMEKPVQPVMPTVEPVMPNVAPQMETPVQPVMPTVEPIMPNVAPQMETPVQPVMPTVEPVMPNVAPQMETPVQPVMPTVEPVMPNVAPQMETPAQPAMPTVEPVMSNVAPQMETPQSLNDFNAANMFVTGNNNQ